MRKSKKYFWVDNVVRDDETSACMSLDDVASGDISYNDMPHDIE